MWSQGHGDLQPIGQVVLLNVPLLSKQASPLQALAVSCLPGYQHHPSLCQSAPQSQHKVSVAKVKKNKYIYIYTERQCAYKTANFQIL